MSIVHSVYSRPLSIPSIPNISQIKLHPLDYRILTNLSISSIIKERKMIGGKMISRFTSVQCIELFHLLFLDQLGRKIEKSRYALKGGCNLRFFLKSIRYSQDMDLDIHTVRKETLSNQVDRLLESAPFSLMLRAKNMELTHVSAPNKPIPRSVGKFS